MVEDTWYEPPPAGDTQPSNVSYNESFTTTHYDMTKKPKKFLDTTCKCDLCSSRFHVQEDCPNRPRCKLCRAKLLSAANGDLYCVACGPAGLPKHHLSFMVESLDPAVPGEVQPGPAGNYGNPARAVTGIPSSLSQDLVTIYETLAATDSRLNRMIVLDTACRKTISGDGWQQARDDGL